MNAFARLVLSVILFPPVIAISLIFRAFSSSKTRRQLIWGPIPIISNKYWAEAMKGSGLQTTTLMDGFYASINSRGDYNLLFEDVTPKWIHPKALRRFLGRCFAFSYVVRNAAVIHLPFSGGPLGNSCFWRIEAELLKFAGVRTVLIPYGADAYIYSQVADTSLRHGLLLSYPNGALAEFEIRQKVTYWQKRADVVICCLMMDGMSRWDILTPNLMCIDTNRWSQKVNFSKNDGSNGPVRIMHTPNHRGFKGTEFLIAAVDQLKKSGLNVDLILLEKVPNENVRDTMQQCDILVEQLIVGYALSAMEGMASGLAVVSNLESSQYTVFRRYSFLNECPIASATPESIADTLRILITNPRLRQELGEAGRRYVEKYHSFKTAQYVFGTIYQKLLEGKEVDLMNLFHPLKSKYCEDEPRVTTPLINNRIPASLYPENITDLQKAAHRGPAETST